MKYFRFLLFIFFVWITTQASFELGNIAWDSGTWLGKFSFKWFLILLSFIIFAIVLLFFSSQYLWRKQHLQQLYPFLLVVKKHFGNYRFLLIPVFLISSLYLFRYSYWGFVFSGTYLRVFIWSILVLLLGMLLSRSDDERLITWEALLKGLLVSGTTFTLASAFSSVSSYPFNLYWSDGNRIWDYSVLFGRDLYNYPQDQPLEAFISIGRQFLWGIPFLVDGISIFWVRFWSAFVLTIPYMVLGWLVFKPNEKRDIMWVLAGLWAFLFLNQGPIYTPLVLSAILVAIAWRRPLFITLPLIFLAGYYAQAARWTWLFAPAMWIVILEFSGATIKHEKVWKRSISSGIAGIFGGYLFPQMLNFLQQGGENLLDVSEVSGSITRQPLLWYRLLPNETYPEGLLLGTLIAILPALILLVYASRSIDWKFPRLQKTALWGSLFAFLLVGLIISTKIGGGNNLHNLDMFLIALLFVLATAWKHGRFRSFFVSESSVFIKLVVFLLIALPALKPLLSLRPKLSLTQEEIKQIQVLTDFEPNTDAPLETLPSEDDIEKVLTRIRTYTIQAAEKGEVLFIDQRQLLTFGYVPSIPLIPDYEKKLMMEQSMRNNAEYFIDYYRDLSNHRFSMIISEPLKTPVKEEGAFSEEGDAWTKWVAAPTLCFYEPIETFKAVYIQLLVPRTEPLDCSVYINKP